jgi:aerobic C4-dicarboxylate transport protein
MFGAHASRFYLYVLAGIIAGVLIGCLAPGLGVALKPLGDGFIDLIKMLITPLIFLSVALGICGARDMAKAGRVGVKSIVYFEVISTLAFVIGLAVVTVLRPGSGFNVDPRTLDAGAVAVGTSSSDRLSRRSWRNWSASVARARWWASWRRAGTPSISMAPIST